jgi:hypothetical protein
MGRSRLMRKGSQRIYQRKRVGSKRRSVFVGYKHLKGVSHKTSQPSPTGLGKHARATKIGTKMKGRDGKMWTVVRRSNGSRYWRRV